MPGSRTSSTSSCASDLASASRHQRNLAEKQRRDKLNGYINELANIVPMVSMATKRLDKTSILRLSAAHIRIYQNLGSHRKRTLKNSNWRPKFLTSDHLSDILEAVDGFIMVTTSSGKIMYVSQSVEQLLGHQHIEMIGCSLYPFVHTGDHETLKTQFQNLTDISHQRNGNGIASERCSFFCRMKERSQPRSEVITYQLVHIMGHATSSTEEDDEAHSNQEKPASGTLSSTSSMLFKAFIRLVHSNPHTELSLTDALEDEYVTRHRLDGTIMYADHRLSYITGHLPYEVVNLSAYNFISPEDIPVTLFAHKFMFANASGTGMTVYRLRTRSSSFVYLRSIGYLQFDKTSNQIDQFICVNKLLSEEEGKRELKKFSEHFTPHVVEQSTDGAKALHLVKFSFPVKLQGLDDCRSSEEEMTVDINLSTPSSCTSLDSPSNSWVNSGTVGAEAEAEDTLGEHFPALRAAITSPSHFANGVLPAAGSLDGMPVAVGLISGGNAQAVLDENVPNADLSVASSSLVLNADAIVRSTSRKDCQSDFEPMEVQCAAIVKDACFREITRRKHPNRIASSPSPKMQRDDGVRHFGRRSMTNGGCHPFDDMGMAQEANCRDECSRHVKTEPPDLMDTCSLSPSDNPLCIRGENVLDSAKSFLNGFPETRAIGSQSTSPVGLSPAQVMNGSKRPSQRVNGHHHNKSGHGAHSLCSCSGTSSCQYCLLMPPSSSDTGPYDRKKRDLSTAREEASSKSSPLLRDRSASGHEEEQHCHLSLISLPRTALVCPVDPNATR